MFRLVACLLSTMEHHYIYLSSNGDRDIFPNNTCDMFTNRIQPLSLESNTEYEIGLIKILLPDCYYTMRREDPECRIEITIKNKYSSTVPSSSLSHYADIGVDVLSNDFNYLLYHINKTIQKELEAHSGEVIKLNKPVIEIKEGSEHITINTVHINSGSIEEVIISFQRRIANALGVVPQAPYIIMKYVPESTPLPLVRANAMSNNSIPLVRVDTVSETVPPLPVNRKGDVQSVLVYTDLVMPSRYGGQCINVLDTFSLDRGVTKGTQPVAYKQLNSKQVETTSIRLTDQSGRRIVFQENYSVTCLLHIKPK